MADIERPDTGIVSLEEHARKRSGAAMVGSVNDFATRKEVVHATVNTATTVYNQIAEEHGKAFSELERQLLERIHALEARLTTMERSLVGRVALLSPRDMVDKLIAEARALPADATSDALLDPDRTELAPIREYQEWGDDSDLWIRAGGVGLGPDYLHPGPEFRRLRCWTTATLRAYCEALGADPTAIEDGETSKAVEGAVLADVRTLIAGGTLTRGDTKPEVVP